MGLGISKLTYHESNASRRNEDACINNRDTNNIKNEINLDYKVIVDNVDYYNYCVEQNGLCNHALDDVGNGITSINNKIDTYNLKQFENACGGYFDHVQKV